MADKQSKAEKLFAKYLTKMSSLLASEDASSLLKGLSDGNNTYMRIDRVESSAFDNTWIEKIEDVIYDLGEIVANPRQNTKIVTDIVPVELARKTNAESVRHLASHTQFIKDITDGGDVIPSKILNIGHEDDLVTYENRFIATFIRKLVVFVEKRYEYVSKLAQLRDEEVLMVKNHSFIDNSEIEIETKIKVKSQKEDESGVKTNAYIRRIEKIREYIFYFYSCPFMKKMKTERDVRNPILQTNIIRKNHKYHHCYEVYRFIEKYDSLGVNYKVDESYSQFNNEELAELNYLNFVNFLTLKAKHMSDSHKTNTKSFKPKVLTSSDEESFIYGPLVEGPIKFVRADEEYQQFLDSQIRKDLPIHPSNKEREYYAEEYAVKNQNKAEQAEVEKLNKRKSKEAERFDKLFKDFVKEREEEEERVRILVEQAVKELEEARLNAVREELKKQAQEDFGIAEEEQNPVTKATEQAENTAEKPQEHMGIIEGESEEIAAEGDQIVTEEGRYILHTKRGYYVGVARYTRHKAQARVYTDLKKLNRIHLRQHGEIIKLH